MENNETTGEYYCQKCGKKHILIIQGDICCVRCGVGVYLEAKQADQDKWVESDRASPQQLYRRYYGTREVGSAVIFSPEQASKFITMGSNTIYNDGEI